MIRKADSIYCNDYMALLSLRKPTVDELRRFLDGQRSLDFTYPAGEGDAAPAPPGYRMDQARGRLGEGAATFEAARAAVARWKPFDNGWVELAFDDTPIRAGEVVAVVTRVCGVWCKNACRIVRVIDEEADGVRRFGFVYGTLPVHAERGEERFMVEWNRADNSVWYEVCAFSRPNHPLVWLVYPYACWLQDRFRRDSIAAMQRAVDVAASTAATP